MTLPHEHVFCDLTREYRGDGLLNDEILAEAELPIRLMAATPCYRREAGSAGRDTRGLLRSHEFDKTEILCVATPEQAPALLDEMVGRAESPIASSSSSPNAHASGPVAARSASPSSTRRVR